MADTETPPAAPATQSTEAAAIQQLQKEDDATATMNVKIYAPFRVYFEGEATSISAVNEVGPFDILPRHHNFLCMLVPCTITVHTTTAVETVKISRALMHVKADRVVVFVDV